MELPEFPENPWSKVGLLAIYVCLSSFGLYKLKSSPMFGFSFVFGFGCYALGFLLWMWLLRSLPLSIAFPSAAGGLMVATLLTGYFVLDEQLQPLQWLGVVLVFLAICLIYFPTSDQSP